MTRRDPMLRSIERAERQEMASTVTFRRPSGMTADAGGDVSTATTITYQGKATVVRSGDSARNLTHAEDAVTVSGYEVIVPSGSDVAAKDAGTVDTSPDADLEGVELRAVEVVSGDWTASTRVVCEAIR